MPGTRCPAFFWQKMKKIIAAIDSFKGCVSSAEANQAAAEGIMNEMPDAEVIQIPVSDGGEGWLAAFHAALGGEMLETTVFDPLLRRITASYLMLDDTAVIEIAQASGLPLLSAEERNPLRATSYGTGQLVADAVRRGCKHVIVGLGGSATSDCGMGMLHAIIDTFAKGQSWDDVTAMRDVKFTIATDVRNPLCGENGAAHVFAPQKGATPDMVLTLDARAKQFADFSAKHFGHDCRDVPGAGAAGGMGYAFLQYMQAECRSGIDLLLEAVDFDRQLEEAALVITGEGTADRQTLMGKLPFGILQKARQHHIPVALMAGRIKDEQQLLDAGFSCLKCINPPGISIEEAMRPETAKKNIFKTAKALSSPPYLASQGK